MESEHDILVIGGGVIGVCSAYYLALKGFKVTLIEKNEIASGCSDGNAGLIVPSYAIPLASPGALGDGLRWLFDSESPFYIKPRFDLDLIKWLARFVLASRMGNMLRSMPVLRDLLFTSRVLFDELAQVDDFDFRFNARGSLSVCLTQSAFEKEKEETHLLERFDIPVRVVDQEEVHELEPALLPNVIGGVYYPKDGRINPALFVIGLADKARELGVQIWSKTGAIGFETSNRKITGVHTTRGVIHPKQIVLGAGSWSPEMARGLNLRLPIQAAKGYSITLENPPVTPKLPLFFSEAHAVANPLGDALRIAGTLELAGMDFSFNSRRIDAIRRSSCNYLPGLDDAKVIEIWRGLRPCTPDGLPIISRSRDFNNLIVATGHAMLGISLGPITGRLVSQLVGGEKTDVDLTPFRMERF